MVHAQLREARGDGDVHGLDRRTVDASADAQAVAALEAADASLHDAVEIIGAVATLRAHVAPQDQDATHGRNALVVIAGADHARTGNGRPAAIRDDALEPGDGLFHGCQHVPRAQRHLALAQVIGLIGLGGAATAALFGRHAAWSGGREARQQLRPEAPVLCPSRRQSGGDGKTRRRDRSTDH
jgi:hypothetical protein